MSDIDRPRFALYLVLGLVVCLLGARYLVAQTASPAVAAGTDPAAAGVNVPAAGTDTAGGGERGAAGVSLGRDDGGPVTVDVAGAVRHAGVYRLAAGSRVDDAVRRAGGPARRADLAAVNLAAKLEDGRQVLVPERASTATGAPPDGAAAAPAAAGDPAADDGTTPAAPVNLNTATLAQLDTLDGVGPGIAQRILDYRQQHGGFARVEQLGEVPGIGPKRLATLTPRVAV